MGNRLVFSSLSKALDVSSFDCGNFLLNQWLSKQAIKNSDRGYSKVYVLSIDKRVVAYYSISAGAIERSQVSSAFSRNSPNPIPVIILGRLAVDREYQATGFGVSLLKDCVIRVRRLAKEVGIRAILVHAIDTNAAKFYSNFGFMESRFDEQILLLPITSKAGS